jgi:hypothetical protein
MADNTERFPGEKPGSIFPPHEELIVGSRLSPGQRAGAWFHPGRVGRRPVGNSQ